MSLINIHVIVSKNYQYNFTDALILLSYKIIMTFSTCNKIYLSCTKESDWYILNSRECVVDYFSDRVFHSLFCSIVYHVHFVAYTQQGGVVQHYALVVQTFLEAM